MGSTDCEKTSSDGIGLIIIVPIKESFVESRRFRSETNHGFTSGEAETSSRNSIRQVVNNVL